MLAFLWIVLTCPFSFFRPRHDLALEVLALRHQIMVLKRQTHRSKLHWSDRCLWIILARVTIHWRNSLIIFQPETVIGWQRAGFRMFWRWKSRGRCGRPGKDAELIQLIRRMWALNPTWGSPRIRDELAKLGLAWADYNLDGRLDLVVAGFTGSNRVSRLYRNNVARTNTAPAPPTGLTARLTEKGVTLEWSGATDMQTPASGLTYSLGVSGPINQPFVVAPAAL